LTQNVLLLQRRIEKDVKAVKDVIKTLKGKMKKDKQKERDTQERTAKHEG